MQAALLLTPSRIHTIVVLLSKNVKYYVWLHSVNNSILNNFHRSVQFLECHITLRLFPGGLTFNPLFEC